jgi:inner membrane protein
MLQLYQRLGDMFAILVFMTGRTHDLAAFTTLSFAIAYVPLEPMTLGTVLVAFGANMVGGLTPDLDQPSAALWGKIRGGSLLAKIVDPLLGSHRLLSHSILGIVLFGFLAKLLLGAIDEVLLVDMQIVWWAFMLGVVSHLVMDTLTKDGVPWFFPIPAKIGFPPLRVFRMKTGGFLEKTVIFPGLIAINGYLIYMHYQKFMDFFNSIVR